MPAAPHEIDPQEFLHEHLAQASPDLLWNCCKRSSMPLLSVQADTVCGADYGTRTDERILWQTSRSRESIQ
ncbi:hypothetical protein [Flexivirga alba]|uniref:Uncharacterized protein n=1 Tax=Flexivirga alba TaxID=702742 RepID=A0ABW2AJN5_9MICO